MVTCHSHPSMVLSKSLFLPKDIPTNSAARSPKARQTIFSAYLVATKVCHFVDIRRPEVTRAQMVLMSGPAIYLVRKYAGREQYNR